MASTENASHDLLGQVGKRRRSDASTRDSKLYDLFFDKLPKHRTEYSNLDVKKIARDLEMSTWGVYKWFKNDKIPPAKVRTVMTLKGSLLTMDDVLPFVIE